MAELVEVIQACPPNRWLRGDPDIGGSFEGAVELLLYGRFGELIASKEVARYIAELAAVTRPPASGVAEELRALLRRVIEHPTITLCHCGQPDCLTWQIQAALGEQANREG